MGMGRVTGSVGRGRTVRIVVEVLDEVCFGGWVDCGGKWGVWKEWCCTKTKLCLLFLILFVSKEIINRNIISLLKVKRPASEVDGRAVTSEKP